MNSAVSRPPVSVDRISIGSDRIVATLSVAHARFGLTSPRVMARVLECHPNLLRHTCINDEGDTFGAVADHTSIPHLIEHLAIDSQVNNGLHERRESPATFVGSSRWGGVNSDGSRNAQVEISFSDDRIAIRALNEAVALVNGILAKDSAS